jgi:hypothetical protein
LSAWIANSSEMSLNWLGASTNSLRILLASSIAEMKSPTLKPKLIVTLNTVSLPHKKESYQKEVVWSRWWTPRASRGHCGGAQPLRPRTTSQTCILGSHLDQPHQSQVKVTPLNFVFGIKVDANLSSVSRARFKGKGYE